MWVQFWYSASGSFVKRCLIITNLTVDIQWLVDVNSCQLLIYLFSALCKSHPSYFYSFFFYIMKWDFCIIFKVFLNNSSVYDHLSRFYFGHAPWIFLSFLCESLYVTIFRVVLERRWGEADRLSGTHFRIGCWIGRRLCSLRRMKASALCKTHTETSANDSQDLHMSQNLFPSMESEYMKDCLLSAVL